MRQDDVARQTCEAMLQSQPIARVLTILDRHGLGTAQREQCIRSLWRTWKYPAVLEKGLEHARQEAGDGEPYWIERAMLAEVCSTTAIRIEGLSVDPFVKRLIHREFSFYCSFNENWNSHFNHREFPFRAYCGQALLERFPAGVFSWNQSGLPRSSFLEAPLRQKPGLISQVLKMGGFSPCFEPHMAVLRSAFTFLVERECLRSYHRMARSMELQPGVRGLMASSWLFDAESVKLTPHLAFLPRLFEENGGMVVPLRPASEDAGFLEGSEARRRAFHAGSYKPKETLVLWPRKAFLGWAKRHPELADPN